MKPSCAMCHYLRKCNAVTARRIEEGYNCEDWLEVGPVELGARRQVIKDFGVWALRFDVPRLEKKKRRPKARRRKKNG